MFTSSDEIRREFKLEMDNPLDMRRELRKIQSGLHPDRNSGQFASEEARDRYDRLQAAIDFLDKRAEPATAVVPLDVVTELVKTLQHSSPVQERREEVALARQVDATTQDLRSSHMLPKISASAASIVLTAVWLFPSTIEEHPVLGPLISGTEPFFSLIWIVCLILTASVWVFLTGREQRQRAFATKIKTEFYQNRLFEQFLAEEEEHAHGALRFRKDDFVQWLLRRGETDHLGREPSLHVRPRASTVVLLRQMHRAHIDPELAQGLADVIFTRAEESGVISRIGTRSLRASYTLNESS